MNPRPAPRKVAPAIFGGPIRAGGSRRVVAARREGDASRAARHALAHTSPAAPAHGASCAASQSAMIRLCRAAP